MTITCYQILPSGRFSFPVSTNLICLALLWLLFIQLKPHYLLICGFILLWAQLCLLFIIIQIFSSHFADQPVLFTQLENVNKQWNNKCGRYMCATPNCLNAKARFVIMVLFNLLFSRSWNWKLWLSWTVLRWM